MKHISLTLFTLLFALCAKAQLTQANHAPANGDTAVVYQCDSTGVVAGAGGQDVIWTFSMPTHSNITHSVVATNTYDPSYPTAEVLVKLPAADQLIKSTSTRLYCYGNEFSSGSAYVELNYTAPAVLARYPMSYTSSINANTNGYINAILIVPVSGTFTGNSSAVADGTGTLVLPGNTYNDVLRVLLTETMTYTANPRKGAIVLKTYQYYQPGIKAPVFTISTASVSYQLGSFTQTLVTRLKHPDDLVGINDPESMGALFQVFPNPAGSVLNVSAPAGDNGQASLYDLSGRLLLTQEIRNGRLQLNVSGYDPGLYHYVITDGNQRPVKSGKVAISR